MPLQMTNRPGRAAEGVRGAVKRTRCEHDLVELAERHELDGDATPFSTREMKLAEKPTTWANARSDNPASSRSRFSS
jgi:hypothetical protein